MASNVSYWQAKAILDYYGYDSTIWQKVKAGTATDTELLLALSKSDAVETVTSTSGAVLGYDWNVPIANNLDDILAGDSNAIGGSYESGNSLDAMIPSNFDDSGTSLTINSGVTNHVGQTVAAVADKVNLAVIGTNIGAKLGKYVGSELYQADPQWWADHLPDVGPWFNDVFGQDDILGKFVRTFLTVDDNGATAYIDERVLASYYQMMRDNGFWETGTLRATYTPGPGQVPISDPHITQPVIVLPGTYSFVLTNGSQYFECTYDNAQYIVIMMGTRASTIVALNTTGTSIVCRYKTSPSGTEYTSTTTIRELTYNNTECYYNAYAQPGPALFDALRYYPHNTVDSGSATAYLKEVVTIIYDGSISSPVSVPGIGNIDNATQFPPAEITGTTTEDVLTELKQTYPELFSDPVTSTVLQPDGTMQTQTYIPIPWIDGYAQNTSTPTSDGLDKTQTQDKIIISPDTFAQLFPETIPQTDTPNPPNTDVPNTGTGSTDPIVLPTGQASSLWAIYNPTQAQVNSFGGWLWSSDFVEQLKKLFSDPMQAIIGIHKVFATPHTGESRNIVCGYLDSGIPSKIVTSQYSDVNCGSINLWEYFGNVFDYAPYTTVKLFLPFIGIVPLDVADVMRSTITVTYTVDVLTGACIANVSVNRDGVGGVIYTYAGSAIVSYPISSGSYMGVVSGAISVATGIIGAMAGGPALPAIGKAVSGLSRSRTNVQHSGQFSGAAGAMGGKKPYLIISRPQTRVAGDVNRFDGYPSNTTIKVGECSGYTNVQQVHIKSSSAYDSELTEIEQLLKDGVIV